MNNQLAFPIIKTAPDGSVFIEPGMSLRDYFAAKAMQAYIQYCAVRSTDVGEQFIAECAYQQADAMLAERERGSRIRGCG